MIKKTTARSTSKPRKLVAAATDTRRIKFFPSRFRRASADSLETSAVAASAASPTRDSPSTTARAQLNTDPASQRAPLGSADSAPLNATVAGGAAAASPASALPTKDLDTLNPPGHTSQELDSSPQTAAKLDDRSYHTLDRGQDAIARDAAVADGTQTTSVSLSKPATVVNSALAVAAESKPLPLLPTAEQGSARPGSGEDQRPTRKLLGDEPEPRSDEPHADAPYRKDTKPKSSAAAATDRLTTEFRSLTPSNTGLRDLSEDSGLLTHRIVRADGTSESNVPDDLDLISPTTIAPSQGFGDTAAPRFRLHEPSPPALPPAQPVPLAPEPRRSLTSSEDTDQALRKQSLAYQRDHQLVRSLLQSHEPYSHQSRRGSLAIDRGMVHRKIWVKRPGASATLVQITEDDLVDDVRDMILKKYANSLGRSFDSPDVTLRIASREHSHSHRHAPPTERVLGPEEHMTRTLDMYYPGGQTVDEALIIDVPVRRTPRHSPHVALPYYTVAAEDMRPAETDQGYFPPVHVANLPSPLAGSASVSVGSDRHGHQHHNSISVLNTGVVPPLPSPGSRTTRPSQRPRLPRQSTSSPTAVASQPPNPENRLHSNIPNPPPISTPPIANQVPARTATPPPVRAQSPRPTKQKRPSKKNTSTIGAPSSQPGPLLDGTVPSINVLIVEDNIINLKLLEAFMKRLKVRWHTAMNGRDAVTKWKHGGFHLVLMDIQLPIMSGLEATKEIRRLERCNGVGVLAANGKPGDIQAVAEKDRLGNLDLFKSSVIIVALTASSLQSDRHEALAAGCNDFLTKPVNFVWLERKVTEWGCMQALIDFDGWRKWKELAGASKGAVTTSTAAKIGKGDAAYKSTLSPPSQPLAAATASSSIPAKTEGTPRSGQSSDSSGSEHSHGPGNGQAASQQPTTSASLKQPAPQILPDLTIQAPTPPAAPLSTTTSSPDPFITSNASASAHRPSPLQQSSSATSPPQVGIPTRESDRAVVSPDTSPTAARRNGSGAGSADTSSSSKPKSPRERDAQQRRAKRASLGLGGVGGLSGVREDDEGPSGPVGASPDRQRDIPLESVGA